MWLHLFIPQLDQAAKHVGVVSGVAHKLPLEESHVKAGGVKVHKLEKEHLHCQPVFIFQMSLWYLCGNAMKELKAGIAAVFKHVMNIYHNNIIIIILSYLLLLLLYWTSNWKIN